jgi:hypothetical protein
MIYQQIIITGGGHSAMLNLLRNISGDEWCSGTADLSGLEEDITAEWN